MSSPPFWIRIILSVFAVFVFIQSLFFKFTASAETLHIFTTLNDWAAAFGLHGLFLPPGILNYYVIGTAEFIASALMLTGLIPRYRVLNALGTLLGLGIMSGAVFFHLFTPLGIEVQNDGGLLFSMAVAVWFSCAALIALYLRPPSSRHPA